MIRRLRGASDGLAFRFGVMLAAALLPLGLISVSQTAVVVEKSRRNAEANLLALTAAAAGGEEGLLRNAFGAAQAISSFVPLIRDDPALCTSVLKNYLDTSSTYSFAGFINSDGIVECSSSPQQLNLSDNKLYLMMKEDPRPRITMSASGSVSGVPVIVVSIPIRNNGEYNGHVSVSLPHGNLHSRDNDAKKDSPLDLVLFNDTGEILSASGGMNGVEVRLPAGRPLQKFVDKPQQSFTGITRMAEERVFAVVPVVPGLIYALGSWPSKVNSITAGAIRLAIPLLFPVLMWLASLAVAYVAVERLVIRPTRNLRARMLMFMRSRAIQTPRPDIITPKELREIDETWHRLAVSVLRDEAELEDMIHDKTVLLKEVHHRVKNNLQLIASILNMKIRKSTNDDARVALRDVQGRVMSLATVHRNLYETSLQGRVQADELVKAIVDRVVSAGSLPESRIEIRQSADRVILYPDQAVPLSLAVSEAASNALKYIGKPADGQQPWLEVTLRETDDANAVLRVANSLGEHVTEASASADSGGLGSQLIAAFVAQLEGTMDVTEDTEMFVLEINFPIAEFKEK
ncbi:histidine kinase dimerization/phosphoacceptor domain -containing protein [Primorskyibacter marinus]|uniref:histidine kinase dimerization/phosphoacceptor domain -containing protein n=1 Tax=Primorskyibacter marinus TaxID=1977320 RepID=UPI000E304891|nr:histidine kinase dimerization/phosphoacceptor domain -containing protein [Primorskyibacter marinus]